jgi:hypothetical protein
LGERILLDSLEMKAEIPSVSQVENRYIRHQVRLLELPTKADLHGKDFPEDVHVDYRMHMKNDGCGRLWAVGRFLRTTFVDGLVAVDWPDIAQVAQPVT